VKFAKNPEGREALPVSRLKVFFCDNRLKISAVTAG
jgi:hypothetical protein